jgi:hypothetical protein
MSFFVFISELKANNLGIYLNASREGSILLDDKIDEKRLLSPIGRTFGRIPYFL